MILSLFFQIPYKKCRGTVVGDRENEAPKKNTASLSVTIPGKVQKTNTQPSPRKRKNKRQERDEVIEGITPRNGEGKKRSNIEGDTMYITELLNGGHLDSMHTSTSLEELDF